MHNHMNPTLDHRMRFWTMFIRSNPSSPEAQSFQTCRIIMEQASSKSSESYSYIFLFRLKIFAAGRCATTH